MNNNYMDFYKEYVSKKSKLNDSDTFLLKFTLSPKNKKDLNNTG